ncbi:pilus assembly protein [Rhodanobacter denitrificans]|uniref:Type II secretion system protein H n=1 Tax=Rhodanobacter denitrificans TaxID=666685 RepID=A0A368KGZ9_9GAMM|nr:GspH/FimT family pseudopilin [Rhodanobacter denitrificans]RCS30448.1 pilus assembly protein [Rhodanobacter denitrificans]
MTLIEQIVVLLIITAVTSISIPVMAKLLGRNHLQVAQADFITALRHARETAIMSGRRTLLCPSRNGSSCSEGSHWEDGWLLAHDADHNDQPDNRPLRVGSGYRDKLIIRSSSGRPVVRFHPDGTARGSNLTLLFCQRSGAERALSVVVSNAGRVRGAPASLAQTAACRE